MKTKRLSSPIERPQRRRAALLYRATPPLGTRPPIGENGAALLRPERPRTHMDANALPAKPVGTRTENNGGVLARQTTGSPAPQLGERKPDNSSDPIRRKDFGWPPPTQPDGSAPQPPLIGTSGEDRDHTRLDLPRLRTWPAPLSPTISPCS